MFELDLPSLLSPLADDAPCGPDLSQEPEFSALERLLQVRAEQQFGDKVIPAQEPDWVAVHEQALALAQRTRDLRIAILLMRSGARLFGLKAANQGLILVQRLLEQHWSHVYPLLDASDGDDPVERMNVLLNMSGAASGLADWRSARLTDKRNSLTVRQIELATGKAVPLPGESVPTAEGVARALQEARAQDPDLDQRLTAGSLALQGIEAVLTDKVDSSFRPDLRPLRTTLQALAQWPSPGAADSANAPAPEAVVHDASGPSRGAPAVGTVSVAGVIQTREDAIQALERVCAWIELHEPSHPAPLLIRRGQRLMSKTFIEIVRDLVPDGLDQVNRLAGLESS